MSCRYTIDEIRQIVAQLAKQYGAQRVYLFGSYARGDSDEKSDIDLRIDKGAIRGLALAGLLVDLEDALGVSVDLIPTDSLDSRFLHMIHDDEVLLYEAS
ncbi:nucleotidyltransferase domain-containing protein [Butyricicoccus faecihominis]|uniref:nucleotidyltransferase family protein n=1 Tax=Butyricicoccus faecihominis TaxID=1712515 RepID=UPI002479F586|nr:nucleotidyltransferase domain-containing protein [Butyricicoccus faecihominis]MCQ5128182.1 nucleotidyltransferase domain-containing protein [Butyricicoccus faecihominis]